MVVMLYVRYPLSLRNVEDLLFERGIDLCRQHRRVRRDDKIFNQTALQAETGNAKWSILIIEMKVAHVVCSF